MSTLELNRRRRVAWLRPRAFDWPQRVDDWLQRGWPHPSHVRRIPAPFGSSHLQRKES